MKPSVESAFEMWWEKLRNLRNKFCRETYLFGYEKEDIEQECYFIFRETWENYDESLGVTFGTYYRARLYGWRANMNRKIKLRQFILLEDETGYVDETISIEEKIISKMLCEKCLSVLSDIEYEIICEYYMKQMPLKVIAERLNLKYRTVENKKQKALEKLRKEI